MVNDLLDFGRIGTGKLRLAPRPLKLFALASMAVEAARPAAEAKGLHLMLEPGPSGAIVGDPDRLLQVIANLLSNATKFTPRGGRIAVRLREPEWSRRTASQRHGAGDHAGVAASYLRSLHPGRQLDNATQ